MLNNKMIALIDYVNSQEAERDDLVHTMALALLTRKNMFVLGDPGQSKSHAIDLFSKQIKGAELFKTVMSKETDEEKLFGRLSLSSIIPGNVSRSVCEQDQEYIDMTEQLKKLLANYRQGKDSAVLSSAAALQGQIAMYKKCLAELYGDRPEYNTAKKIPEADLCFLDEIFKAGEGLINSLLDALNEREYTNEGVTTQIPVISFFAASNEIPNFKNLEEQILRALYDRFDLKVKTENVREKENRFRILHMKQSSAAAPPFDGITLDELRQMQAEVAGVSVNDTINNMMDNIVCELREKGIIVSDRTYFNFSPIVQAEAWLNGRTEVIPSDLQILKNYLWNQPEEISVIVQLIRRLIENPLGDQLNEILNEAYQYRDEFDNVADKVKALRDMKERLLKPYAKALKLKESLPDGDDSVASVNGCLDTLEGINRAAFAATSFTCIPLAEQMILKGA